MSYAPGIEISRPFGRIRTQLAAALLLVLITTPLEAAPANDWLADAWRVEEGLPDNTVDAIVQTPDGFLWLGTQGGLARFDGVSFSTVDDPALKIARVWQLYLDRSGRLWVIGELGNVAFIHNGQVRSFSAADGVPPNGLQAPTEDASGQVWFSAREEEGCFYFDGARFVNIVPENGPRLGQFNNLAFDSDGTLYGGRLGQLWKLFPGSPSLVAGRAEPERVPLLCPSRQGGFWFIARSECFLVRGGKWQHVAEIPYELPTMTEAAHSYEDSAGHLWVINRQRSVPVSVTTNGLVAQHPFTLRPNLNCRAFFEDREGNRWWSVPNDGMRRFRPRQLESVSNGANLSSNTVLAVAADTRQGVWALIGRGVIRITNTTAPTAVLLTNAVMYPVSLWVDPETVWVGAHRTGLYRLASGSFDKFHNEGDPEVTFPFSALFRDARGDLLAGSAEGLFHFAGDKITRVEEADILDSSHGDFRAFAQDHQGRLYAGLRNGGLLLREGSQWSQATDTLPGDDIAALWCDADDTLWIGVTGHGLCRLKNGKTFSFQPTRLRLPRNIYGMVEDDCGFLWLSSSEGIFRVSRAQLNAVADGRGEEAPIRWFDKSDGMLSAQCTGGQQPVSARSSDGRLWFATTSGLYFIDPSRLPQNDLPPPVTIEEVLIDDKPVWKRPLNSSRVVPADLKVSPNNSRLEFRFTALSLAQPQRNRFRFQLTGLNRDWVEAGTQRVAYYTRVPSGHYQFKVIACNNDGLWNETGATFAISVLPHLWQTLWFRTLALASSAALLFGAYRWRVRGLEQERVLQQAFARTLLESQEQERRRIAAELHDSLGQSLLTVKNYATMALKEPTLPEKTQKQLTEISDSASASIEEVRSIARALRPYQLDRFGLTKTLEDTVQVVTRAGNVQIKAEIENIDGLFPSDVEISIYRIAQESLNNVVKHARATTGRFEVHKVSGAIRMTVEDNGVGFDYEARLNHSSSGLGLANLRERVRLLGGTLKIESSTGRGTRLVVEIPWKA
jgi:signal transduction histidine kinase/ligand-binding sensor domain-containing protein